MINYVYCHIGTPLPDYIFDSFLSVNNVETEARILLITDQKIELDSIEVFYVNDIASAQTQKAMNMPLFKYEENNLWRTSIFRIFLVRDLIKYLNLEYCYHFDSDVLLFVPSKYFELSINDFDGLYITYHNEYEVVFGFSRFGNIKKIDKICEILFDIIFDDKKQNYYSSGGMPNEMRLLCGIMNNTENLIKTLNILPNKNGIVFDPSSYGQYFGGTHQGHGPGFFHESHIIGRKISSKEILPILIDEKPYVRYNNIDYPIVNLHIHSKNTKQFL